MNDSSQMTLAEMQSSPDTATRVRGSLLTEKDLHNWLCSVAKPKMPITASQGGKGISVQLDVMPLITGCGNGVVPLILGFRSYLDVDINRLNDFFGEPVESESSSSVHYITWELRVSQWPFIIVEALMLNLYISKQKTNYQVSTQLARYLEQLIPGVLYDQLATWYDNGFFTIEADIAGLPTLAGALNNLASNGMRFSQELPTDFEP